MIKLKFKCDILKKMFKNLSTKYYEENKKDYQRKLVKDIKIFLKKKKEKSNSQVRNDTKIYQIMKNNSFLSIEKNMIRGEQMLYYNYKKLLF